MEEKLKPTPKEIIDEISVILTDADSISTFVEALKTANLSEEDVSEGITVFAPLNENPAPEEQAGSTPEKVTERVTTEKVTLEENTDPGKMEVTDHVVKGVLKFSDLTDGRELTALSGKKLKITREGDNVWINGVAIGGAEVASDDNQIVFVVKQNLSNTQTTDEPEPTGPATLNIKVWDGSQWDLEHPKGAVAAGAEVVLYRSPEDYANSIPAYTETAGENGMALFAEVEPGDYFIEVSLGDKSNIFFESEQPADGVYTGLGAAGIFDSQASLEEAGSQPGKALGNFRWQDVNGDGTITNADRVPLPVERVTIGAGAQADIQVLIGYENNLESKPLTEEVLLEKIAKAEQDLTILKQAFLVPLDGLLGDEVDQLPATLINNSVQGLDNFSFNATHPGITLTWQLAYNNIYLLNQLLEAIPETMSGDYQQTEAHVRGLRAYTYLQLMTYFGNIPIQEGPKSEPGVSNSREAALVYIKEELAKAAALLPQQVGPDKTKLNLWSIKALQAKAALLSGEYQVARDLTTQIIQGGGYSLGLGENIFGDNSTEILWASEGIAVPAFSEYFFGRTAYPYLRLTEVYFINAEALIQLGQESQTEAAEAVLGILRDRAGLPPAGGEPLYEQLLDLVKSEMPREGQRFASLLRWHDMAYKALDSKGFQPGKNELLPIPQSVLDQLGLMQNPGY